MQYFYSNRAQVRGDMNRNNFKKTKRNLKLLIEQRLKIQKNIGNVIDNIRLDSLARLSEKLETVKKTRNECDQMTSLLDKGIHMIKQRLISLALGLRHKMHDT